MKKTLSKVEIKNRDLREEVETLLEKEKYDICPYIVRIYDFINIARQNSSDSKRQLGVQCLYNGAIHDGRTRCLKRYDRCKKYKSLSEHKRFMENGKEQKP